MRLRNIIPSVFVGAVCSVLVITRVWLAQVAQ